MQLPQYYGSNGPVTAAVRHPIVTPTSPLRPQRTFYGCCGCAGNRDKWLRTFRAIVDMTCANNKGRDNCGGTSKSPVKTILRPLTKYRYVVGMSGFPSKVAVYPARRK